MTDFEVMPMRRRHVAQVCEIELRNQASPWSADVFRRELSLGDERHYVVAIMDMARVVGFGGLFFAADEAHVTNLSVPTHVRRRGVATRMMVALIDHALALGTTALTLEVRMGNTAAQALYRRFGLAPAGTRRDYYRPDGEDALVMWAHEIDGPEYRERLDAIRARSSGEVAATSPVATSAAEARP